MGGTDKSEPVRCWEEQVVIPTYPVQDADPNPMFLEKRVYQGSSGKVYPNPFTDRVALEKKDQAYRAIMLENEFIQLMILPEIGGRIHAGLDKTNSTTSSIASMSSSRRWWGCWVRGSPAVWSSTGRSTIARPPICQCMQALRSMPTAAAPFGSANTIPCCA